MKDKILKNSFLRFVLVGVCNTLLSLLLMFLLEKLGYWPSTAIAYAAGATLSFFLNRYFTFHSQEDFWRSVGKFVINVAVCYVIAYALAQPLVSWALKDTGLSPVWQERIAKLAGMVLYTLLNYFGQRFFAFRRRRERDGQGEK
jgi:putative flippase GtrA